MAADCPSKPASVCRNCNESGHNAVDCTQSRQVHQSNVPDMDPNAAWKMIAKANEKSDMDDFKDVSEFQRKRFSLNLLYFR